MSNRRAERGGVVRGLGALSAIEQLEPRQLLSADLPTAAEWVDWGNARVGALRDSYIIGFDGQQSALDAEGLARQVAARLGIEATGFRSIARGQYATFETSSPISFELARRVAESTAFVRTIEPNRVFRTLAVPNDPRFQEQWWLQNTGQPVPFGLPGTSGADIQVTQAWNISIGTRNNVVAVIDTGIDLTHPDLIQNLWVNPGEISGNGIDDDGNGFIDDVNGYDFGDNDGNPQDEDTGAHGTPVAGMIGAVGNNGLGMSGVNWNVSLMALKIADRFGDLSTAAIVAAHDYATMMIGRGTNIVASNNSYGGFSQAIYADAPQGIDAERDAIVRFVATGATFVASAGNSSFDNDNPQFTFFPTSYNIPGVIAVAATDSNDQLAGFSNYGVQTVDLGAPGVNTWTTALGGGYNTFGGTSAAGPAVAGAVALLKAVKPNATAVEIREALINGADPLPALQGRVRSGGRLNVFRSMQILQIDGPVVRAVNPGPLTQQFIPGTSTPVSTITVDFSKDIDPATLATNQVEVRFAGADGVFSTVDDQLIPLNSVTRDTTDARRVTIALNLSGFSPQRLPLGNYRLTLMPNGFRDTTGNLLNGNSTSGSNHVYNFRVAAATGDNESNDTLPEATRLTFDANGTARLTGVTLGNGLFGPLDVDLYRLDMVRGGQITAEVTAQRLPAGSSLDSILRVFNANGEQIQINDQFFGNDSYIDLFVQTAGTYYVGVSGFGNNRYNPAVGGSGNTQTTGVYNLAVGVRLAQDDVVTYVGYRPENPVPGNDDFATFDAADGPTTNIPPNAPSQTRGITTSQITIPDSRQVLDVNVRIRLNHTFDGDLIISLIAPNGREVFLSNRRGGDGDNFTNTLFDDEATASITAAAAPFSGAFRPESQTPAAQPNALGLLDGMAQGGVWTLKIEDTTSLNTGQLLNWALDITYQNNIFGPFEANDTLVTARSLNEINGSGAATRTAFLGDGGFGNLDRDIFSFVAGTGTTLTASVASAGVFNSALRLFDSQGNQVLISNPGDRTSSLIDGFVFNNGGTYYLAVSETSNIDYNPTVVGSGTPAGTTGTYTLTVDVAPGVSDPGQVLQGSAVNLGVNTLAGLGAAGTPNTGMRFNGTEFLPGFEQFFGAVGGGLGFVNGGTGTVTLPFALTNESDPQNFRLTGRAQQQNGLRIERTITLGRSDSFFVIDVAVSNASTTTLSSVSWMEGYNPQPGLSLGDGLRTTRNDVAPTGRLATAQYFNNEFTQGLTVGLGAPVADVRARATFADASSNPRDPGLLVAQPAFDPEGALGDLQMVITFDLGNLAAGGSANFRYFIFFGNNPASVDGLYAAMNAGTGAGHLTPNSATPATENLSTGQAVPVLPYRIFFPEGATGDNIFTFVPISNPNSQPVRVVAIARYEAGERDQLVGDLTIAGNSRSGFTLIDPASKAAGTQLVRVPTPENPFVQYSLELRSDRPIAATFSHYDLNLVSGSGNFKAAVGEAFTSVTANSWNFAQVERGGGNTNFIVWVNTTNIDSKVDLFFYPLGGGQAYQTTFTLGALRRGGISINDAIVQRLGQNQDPGVPLPEGTYGVVAVSPVRIVAALSHYNPDERVAEGAIGTTGSGATSGLVAEGQIGLNGTGEQIAVLNTAGSAATVTFSFLFQNGSAYRTVRTVTGASTDVIDVATLPNFTGGTPYSVFYESTAPVIVTARSNAFGGQLATASAEAAYSWWGFGEGFRPGDDDPNHPGVVEYLRLYNPASAATTVEITISYDGTAGTEVFRRTLSARTVSEFNVHDFVVGARRQTNQWYAITVKAPTPIVAYMAHWDRAFPGAFGTLGTPLGRFTPIT
jgi:subtilisin-like proprotein convertase family protein